jgi:hypothetical protein
MRLFHPVPPPGHITSPLQVENIPPLKEPGTGHVPPRSFRVLEFCRSRWKTPTRTLRVIADLDRRRLASWPRAGGVRRIGVWPGRVHLLGGRESDILRWRYAPVEHFTLLSLFRCFVFAFFLSFLSFFLSFNPVFRKQGRTLACSKQPHEERRYAVTYNVTSVLGAVASP